MTQALAREASAESQPTDRFGNPLDPIVRYARGRILRGSDDEVRRMQLARRMVGRETPSRSASSTSFASLPPTGISPLSIIFSSCVATWK